MHLAVFKSYACGYLLHVVSSNLLVEEDVINLLLQEFRMSELAGQIAVVVSRSTPVVFRSRRPTG